MATFHKLTVYVCDPNDCLTLDEIKSLIVEYDKDQDINQVGTQTEAWEKYFPRGEETTGGRRNPRRV